MKTTARKKISGIVFRPDTKQSATLQKLGRAGATNAIRASKALGLPITYMEKGIIKRTIKRGKRNYSYGVKSH